MLFCGWLCCGNWCYGVNYEIGINYKIGRGKFFLIKLIESYGKRGGGDILVELYLMLLMLWYII